MRFLALVMGIVQASRGAWAAELNSAPIPGLGIALECHAASG